MTSDLLLLIEQMTDAVQFERLCADVLTLMGYMGLDPQGVGRRDGGKDAILNHPSFGRVVFHFSLRRDWQKKLKEDIAAVIANKLFCKQLVFFTNRKVTAAEKDSSKRYCQDKLRCDLELFDQERLRIVISAHRSLCGQYFPQYFLATDVVEELTKALKRLTDSGLNVPSADRLRSAPQSVVQMTEELARLVTTGQGQAAVEGSLTIVQAALEFQDAAASGLFFLACLSFEQGDLNTAEIIFKKVLAVSPAHFGAYFDLAIVMEHDGRGRRYGYGFRVPEAIEYYTKALSLADDDTEKADCLDNIGVIFVKLHRVSEARQKFEEAQKVSPTHISSRLNLGTVADSWEFAEEIYLSLLDTPKADLARLNLASAHFFQGRLREAVKTLRRLPHQFRATSAYVYVLLARIALQRKKPKKAELYAEQALLKDYYYGYAHFALGKALKSQGRVEEAIRSLETSISIEPDQKNVYFELADALHLQSASRNLNGIVQNLDAALRLDHSLENVHNNLGNVYFDNKMYASAKQEYLREIEKHPDNKLPYFNLGYLLEHDSRGRRYTSTSGLRAAIAYYKKTLSIDSNYFPALFNLGTALSYLGKYREAIVTLEKCLEARPESDIALCNLGTAYNKIGEREKSMTLWKKALSVNPKNEYAAANLFTYHGLWFNNR